MTNNDELLDLVDQTPSYNPEDFSTANWIGPKELMASLDAGTPAKSTLRGAAAMVEKWL